eukprot:scaffold202575_cov31-Tisochrysis_lutea.AAC.3
MDEVNRRWAWDRAPVCEWAQRAAMAAARCARTPQRPKLIQGPTPLHPYLGSFLRFAAVKGDGLSILPDADQCVSEVGLTQQLVRIDPDQRPT